MLTDSKLFWHSISPEEQRSLVTVDMATLKARAKLLDKESIPTRPGTMQAMHAVIFSNRCGMFSTPCKAV